MTRSEASLLWACRCT